MNCNCATSFLHIYFFKIQHYIFAYQEAGALYIITSKIFFSITVLGKGHYSDIFTASTRKYIWNCQVGSKLAKSIFISLLVCHAFYPTWCKPCICTLTTPISMKVISDYLRDDIRECVFHCAAYNPDREDCLKRNISRIKCPK